MFSVDTDSITSSTNLTTLFGDNDYTVTKYCLIVMTVIILVIGVGGNLLVLLGSIKYKALKMDEVSVILLENLAVADLMMVLMFCVPILCTLVAEKWVLGKE